MGFSQCNLLFATRGAITQYAESVFKVINRRSKKKEKVSMRKRIAAETVCSLFEIEVNIIVLGITFSWSTKNTEIIFFLVETVI